MKFLKQIGFYLFVISAIIAAIFFYKKLKGAKVPALDAVNLIPDSCSVYLTTNNISKLNEFVNQQNLIIDKLNTNLFFLKSTQTLAFLDSIVINNNKLTELSKQTIHFATYEAKNNWVITLNCPLISMSKEIAELLKINLNAVYNNSHYKFKYNNNDAYFLIYKGVVCISNNQDLLEQIINNKHKPFIKSNDYLVYKNTLDRNSALGIYINPQNIDNSKNQIKLPKLLLNNTLALNFSFKPYKINANGILKTNSNSILNLLHNKRPGNFEEENILPFNCVELKQYYSDNFISSLTSSNDLNIYYDSLNYDIGKEFKANIESKLTFFKTNQSIENNVVIKVKDTLNANLHLQLLKDSIYLFQTTSYFKLKNNSELFNPFETSIYKYGWLFNGCVYFFESKINAELTIANLLAENNLSKNTKIITCLKQEVGTNINYLYYEAPDLNNGNINNYIKLNKNSYQNFKHFVFTLKNSSNGFDLHSTIDYEQENENSNGKLFWTCNIDTLSITTPSYFKNHNTTENEIITQDALNQLYLINSKGTIIWKKKINENILSQIYIVDIFKNNKYQMLFNTQNYLHLIDRNGNYVDGYPVKLPSKATNPLSVLDYDNDKNYRLFIACANNKIYNYTIYGLKAEGYTPLITDSKVNLPIQYAKVGLSDYLITADVEGKIYTFSRKGDGRIGLKNKCLENCKDFYVEASNNINNTFFCYLDEENGSVHKISFTDHKEIFNVKSDGLINFYHFDLVDNNRKKDICFTSGNTFFAYDLNGSLIMQKNINKPLFYAMTFINENFSKLIVTDSLKTQTTIFDLNSSKLAQFKSSSNSIVLDLFKTNNFCLIFANGNSINCSKL